MQAAWFQILAAIGAPIAAFIAVGVAAWQGYLQRQQLRHNLYAKRLDVYLSLRRFLNNLPELGKTRYAIELPQDTNQAQFLFKPEIEEFLNEVYKRAHHLQSFHEQEARAERRGMGSTIESASLETKHSWLISEAPQLASRKFGRYLKLS